MIAHKLIFSELKIYQRIEISNKWRKNEYLDLKKDSVYNFKTLNDVSKLVS